MANSTDAESNDSELIDGGTIEALDELQFHEQKHRAETARKMAFLLVWIMAISVGLHFVTTAGFAACGKSDAIEGLTQIFNMWLPVISGLVSSAATYYFTKENTI